MKRKSVHRQRRKSRGRASRIASVHPLVAVTALALLIFAAWRATASAPVEHSAESCDSRELLEVAVADSTLCQQIVEYPGFVVSFNSQMHQPNYVAWELTAEESSAEGRREQNFDTDDAVEGSATLADYRRSGFDRGHMMPAADAKWSGEAMKATFYLTNICPQDHKLNAGAWANLESNCRAWAERDSAIIIVCGPVLSDRMPRSIGTSGQIPVPERFFKVVLAPYSNPPRGIGFVMNNGPVAGGVQATAVSIDEVEAITGFDFFAALPDEIEEEVEAQCAYHIWQRKNR